MIAWAALEQFLPGLMNSASLCGDDRGSVIITAGQQTVQWATADWDQGAMLLMMIGWTCQSGARLGGVVIEPASSLPSLYFSWVAHQGRTVADTHPIGGHDSWTHWGKQLKWPSFLSLAPSLKKPHYPALYAQKGGHQHKNYLCFSVLSILFLPHIHRFADCLSVGPPSPSDGFKECKSSLLLRMWALHWADNITYTLRYLYTVWLPSHEFFMSVGFLSLSSVRVEQVRWAAASSVGGQEQRQLQITFFIDHPREWKQLGPFL